MAATALPLDEFDVWPSSIDQAATPANLNALRDEVALRQALSFEASQPGDPEEGDLYVLSAAWGDEVSGTLAYFRGGVFTFWIPSLGMLKRVGPTDYYTYDPDSSGEWQLYSPGGGTGDVVGPGSATADAVALFDGTTGKLLKDSATTIAQLRTIPQNSQSGAYTLVIADAGKHIFHPSADTTARVFTIPANASVAFPIGTAVTFVNQNSAGVITIAITSDTMRLAGAGTTGSRTLAANGIATALKITSTAWIISGTGLT